MKHVMQSWQVGKYDRDADGSLLYVAVRDDAMAHMITRSMDNFYARHLEFRRKDVSRSMTGTTRTNMSQLSGPTSQRTFLVRLDFMETRDPDEHLELDFPHFVLISRPGDSAGYIGQVIKEVKRDATPHNRYLREDKLGLIEALCSPALSYIVRCPQNSPLGIDSGGGEI